MQCRLQWLRLFTRRYYFKFLFILIYCHTIPIYACIHCEQLNYLEFWNILHCVLLCLEGESTHVRYKHSVQVIHMTGTTQIIVLLKRKPLQSQKKTICRISLEKCAPFENKYPAESGAPGGITRCTSNGDPHFMTFDGRRYDNYRIGDWVMVKSDRRDFAVSLFSCAVFYVKVGDTFFM